MTYANDLEDAGRPLASEIPQQLPELGVPRTCWYHQDVELRFYVDPESPQENEMKQSELPEGWNEEQVRDLLDYYENQSDDEAAAEYEAACSSSSEPMMGVPVELVPKVREMIAAFYVVSRENF